MSGTRLDWISFGLADSWMHMLRQLNRWCNNFARSKGPYPAERVIFNQIQFSMLEWLCLIRVEQRSSYLQTRQSLVAAITWDLKTTLLCEFGHWALPGQRERSRPKQRRDWGIMTLTEDMRSIASPHTDLCGMATASAFRSESDKCRVINLRWHSSGCPPRKPMRQSCDSID
jgi:hypothetical protein